MTCRCALVLWNQLAITEYVIHKQSRSIRLPGAFSVSVYHDVANFTDLGLS